MSNSSTKFYMFAPETAEVGQVMRVSEVDADGKPTAWETTNIQSNWSQNDPTASDYIQNRICYETQETGSAVYTFDGDMTNHETVLYDGVYLVKISDDVLYAPEIVSGSFTTSLDGSGVLDKDMFEDMASQGLPVYALKEIPVIVIVYQDFEFNGTAVSSGVWVMCEPEVPFWVSRFEYNGAINKPKKINKRYIPSEVAAVPVAQVGQTVAVSEIDENGKPIAWEAVDVNETWELLSDVTIEEAVQTIDLGFWEKPQKKIRVVLDTLTADSDTNYMPVTVYTGDVKWNRKIAFYPKAMPITKAARSFFEIDSQGDNCFKLGVNVVAGDINTRESNGSIMYFNDTNNSPCHQNIVRPIDGYGNLCNNQLTGMSVQTYGSFEVGTRIRVWGVAK